MTLEQRLGRAERNQRWLAIALVVTIGGIVGVAAAPENTTWEGQKIVLKHPNGGPSITLSAGENSSGVWIGGQNKQDGKYDVALVSTANGPQLLMASKDGKMAGISPTDAAPADQNGPNLFRFYHATTAITSQPANR